MALPAGSMLGPYEILSALGAGGMGEVYRARDTRLGRNVAIKILNSQLVSSAESRARFEREAQVISQLQHPHICILHDIGKEGGTDFLVMEYLEGESLAERLQKGPLPPPELLKIAVQIARALDRAHRAGIIHRDLKPGNVMLTKSGAKLLDFGLAKPALPTVVSTPSPSAFAATATHSSAPSAAAALSAAGTIAGTVQYMAPEQVQGLATDARSDIFSFGVMLYEMATGKRAFSGKTPASVAGQILAVEPPAPSALQPGIPPQLDRAIRICLEKDPDERFQSVHDLRLQLEAIAEAPASSSVPAKTSLRFAPLVWAAIIAALLGALAAALYFSRIPEQPRQVITSTLLPPEKAVFLNPAGTPVLSPDGTKLAFVAMDENARVMLYVRALNSPTAQPLAGTQDSRFPFWSPDSRTLGFFAENKLKRIDATGGPVQELADTTGIPHGGAWSGDTILYATDLTRVVNQLPAAGGAISPASKLNGTGELAHEWPSFLPDGKHFLFWSAPTREVCLGDLGSLDHKVLVRDASQALYANGYLLFERGASLFAQPFSLRKLATAGDAVPLAEHIVPNPTSPGSALFSTSANDTLIYEGGEFAAGWPLTWYGRDGKPLGKLGPLAAYSGPAISPDGKRVAVTIRAENSRGDIWVFDLARGTEMRLTFDGTSNYPFWSSDGKTVMYYKLAGGQDGKVHVADATTDEILYRKAADNSGPEQVFSNDVGQAGWTSASADGRAMAFMRQNGPTFFDIWGLFFQGDHKPFSVVQTQFLEALPSLSPDGKWLAYFSNETGRGEIYITAFPGGGAKWQVSTDSGVQPRWRGDGKELFFSMRDNTIMAVDVSTAHSTVSLGTPHALFQGTMQPAPLGQFDVSRDGQKFLLNSLNATGGSNPITLVTNWTAQLSK